MRTAREVLRETRERWSGGSVCRCSGLNILGHVTLPVTVKAVTRKSLGKELKADAFTSTVASVGRNERVFEYGRTIYVPGSMFLKVKP